MQRNRDFPLLSGSRSALRAPPERLVEPIGDWGDWRGTPSSKFRPAPKSRHIVAFWRRARRHGRRANTLIHIASTGVRRCPIRCARPGCGCNAHRRGQERREAGRARFCRREHQAIAAADIKASVTSDKGKVRKHRGATQSRDRRNALSSSSAGGEKTVELRAQLLREDERFRGLALPMDAVVPLRTAGDAPAYGVFAGRSAARNAGADAPPDGELIRTLGTGRSRSSTPLLRIRVDGGADIVRRLRNVSGLAVGG